MRVGVLTGGGDCPGLNAVIRAIIRKGEAVHGHSLVGYKYGWKGLVEGESIELSIDGSRGLLHRGGTILGTSRLSPTQIEDGANKVKATMEADNLDAIIAIGGEGTLSGATAMHKEGINVIGVPKTIDNDINATDITFGFHTAVQIATDALDRLHTTAESHNRVMVVEVMGRHAGWIATYSGIAGGADAILVPEKPFDIEKVCEQIKRRHARGVKFSIVVVAEGAMPVDGTMKKIEYDVDEYGHQRLGGIGYRVAKEIEERTGFETRETSLGHILRGGTPTAFDRVLATRFGVAAIDAVHNQEYGKMVALQGSDIKLVSLESATDTLKTVDDELLEVASVFFG
ncbi:MAG: 6-phosphofructokinase [Acidimicrobiia bacterium]